MKLGLILVRYKYISISPYLSGGMAQGSNHISIQSNLGVLPMASLVLDVLNENKIVIFLIVF